jgi:hypothetical protein
MRPSRLPALWLVVLTGCGRLHFDPLGETSTNDGGGDAAALIPHACPIGDTAPDPIVITGRARSINAFGVFNDEPNVMVAALSGGVTGAPIATTTSDGNGDFSLTVPTGGKPLVPYASLVKSGLLTSIWVPDQAIDGDFRIDSAYMTTPAGVSAFYDIPNPNLTRQTTTHGTLLLNIQDCAGIGIEGVTIQITPAAERILYSSNFGIPSNAATSTGPSGRVWALNLPAGTVQVTATKAGVLFNPLDAEIVAGDNYMGSLIRAVQSP